jgi:hypothetical protein
MVKATELNSVESRSASISLSLCKISSKSINQSKSSTSLRSFNVRHFGMVEATRLYSIESKSSSMSSPSHKFHLNPPNGSKVIKLFLYTQLRSLNVRHFGIAQAARLKNVTSRPPWMAVPAYQISRKVTYRFKSYQWGTHRQAGDLISPLSFFLSRRAAANQSQDWQRKKKAKNVVKNY